MNDTPSGVRIASGTYATCKDWLMDFRNANRATPRDAGYFEWRYRKRPAGAEAVIVWAENEAGSVIGALSLIPHPFLLDGRACLVGILGDVSVAPAARGRGIAQRLLQALAAVPAVKELAGCLVLPNEEAARPLRKTGWREIGEIARYVKFIDIAPHLTRLPAPLRQAVTPVLNAALRWVFPMPLPPDAGSFATGIVAEADARFDVLWQRIAHSGMTAAARSGRHLAWRYLQHPSGKYRIFTLARAGELCGYVVYHLDGRECQVDDFLYDEAACQPWHFLGFFVRHVRSLKGVSTISLRRSPADYCPLPLRRAGFLRRRDTQAVMVLAGEGRPAGFLDGSRWFITAGDKDV